LGGEFRYAEGDAKLGWNRIGGIDRCCLVGITSLLGWAQKKRIKYYFLSLFLFLALLGGGRTIFFASILVLLIDFVIINKKVVIFIFSVFLFFCFYHSFLLSLMFL